MQSQVSTYLRGIDFSRVVERNADDPAGAISSTRLFAKRSRSFNCLTWHARMGTKMRRVGRMPLPEYTVVKFSLF